MDTPDEASKGVMARRKRRAYMREFNAETGASFSRTRASIPTWRETSTGPSPHIGNGCGGRGSMRDEASRVRGCATESGQLNLGRRTLGALADTLAW